MTITATADLWWKTAVIYCLDVETYFDADGDGCGDFAGLAQRIDYLADLGITCLWLMPFYPTAERDDGYDITDFYGVDPRLGHHGDVVEVIRLARDRGMRVIVDLVVNHTSIEHPWFRAARSAKDSPFRDYYIWRSDTPPDTSGEVVFPDAESGIWTLEETTGDYYMHRFYREQPDLNVANPVVRDEIAKVMGFWLELGISGFRVDAVPFLLETAGISRDQADAFAEPHEFLRALRSFVGRRTGDGILLGEVNLPHEQQLEFFGSSDGDELTMLFDFIGMQQMYLSLARGDAEPLINALQARPGTSPDSQWATFVRNHDELTLDKLSKVQRQEVFDAFGPQQSMQVFGRGLRRRLPPMLGGDPKRLRMVYSLLFSLPGTPVLFYGEEIGMGENLDVEGRAAVRTPMQWTAGPSGGFSTAEVADLVAPVVTGEFGPEHVNAQDARNDPDSLLAFITLLVRRYRQCPELGWGAFEVLEQPHRQVLAHRCTWGERSMLALHNFGSAKVTVDLALAGCDGGRLIDLLGGETLDVDETGAVTVVLDGYGYRWLRIAGEHSRRLT